MNTDKPHQSVLSTTFFSYDGTVFAICSWWWILPLTAAPLTGLVMFLWFWWFRQRLSRDHATLQTRRDVVEDAESKIKPDWPRVIQEN